MQKVVSMWNKKEVENAKGSFHLEQRDRVSMQKVSFWTEFRMKRWFSFAINYDRIRMQQVVLLWNKKKLVQKTKRLQMGR